MSGKLMKLTGPITINTGTSGAEKDYLIGVFPGGGSVKNANYIVKVLQASHTTNLRISLLVRHSADGMVSAAHSTAINSADPGSTFPVALSGDLDSTKVTSEYLHILVYIKDNTTTNAMWATIEVYEMRKPF